MKKLQKQIRELGYFVTKHTVSGVKVLSIPLSIDNSLEERMETLHELTMLASDVYECCMLDLGNINTILIAESCNPRSIEVLVPDRNMQICSSCGGEISHDSLGMCCENCGPITAHALQQTFKKLNL